MSSDPRVALGRMSAIGVALVARVEPRFADLAGMSREEALEQNARDHDADQEQGQEDVPRRPARLDKLTQERDSDHQEDDRSSAHGVMAPTRRHRSISPK